MPRDLILSLSIVMGLATYALIARWYVMPALLALPRARARIPLLLLPCTRFIGLAFLIPGVTALLVTHVMVFLILLRPDRAVDQPRRSA